MYRARQLDLSKPEQLKEAMDPLLGFGLTPEQLTDVEYVDVWCTSFSDPGDDRTELRLLAMNGWPLRTVTIPGY